MALHTTRTRGGPAPQAGRVARSAALAAALGIGLASGGSWAGAGAEWRIAGGDQANTRFSELEQINTTNVGRLKVAWMHSLGSTHSQETTPLVIDGKMFVSTSAGPRYVFAIDAATGETLWTHQPELPNDYQSIVCCGHANRGLAYADGRLFMGRLDAKLVALDANTGEELWQVEVRPYKDGYSITSPPLIVGDKVIVGHSGGEYGVRGSLQAYDQKTGKLLWRTWTIPGPGEPGNETWKGDSWKTGGAAPWYVASYDPEANLIYYGTSNAAPWGGHVRGNDSTDVDPYTNLYTASQLALNPDDGSIVWYYQMTPSDVWDYDGVNEPILADLDIANVKVPALIKADRNGFFYVLNRKNGELLSAEPYVTVNWAKKVDKETGRPVQDPRYRPRLDKWAKGVCPNLIGGKNWQPMSYNPRTGLVYIPTFNMCMDLVNREQKYVKGQFYLAQEFDLGVAGPGDYLAEFMAWNPVTQKKAWGIKEDLPFLGGALSTAGGLVFYGNQRGILKAVDARTGKILWRFKADSGINQGPVTYEIDGRQYLAVVTGRLVGPPSFFGKIGESVIAASPPGGSVIVFTLSE